MAFYHLSFSILVTHILVTHILYGKLKQNIFIFNHHNNYCNFRRGNGLFGTLGVFRVGYEECGRSSGY